MRKCRFVLPLVSFLITVAPVHANDGEPVEASIDDTPLNETIEIITESGITEETIVDVDATAGVTGDRNWRDGFGLLSVGYLIDGDQRRQRRKLEAFRRAMERFVGLRVLFRPSRTLDQLIAMQVNRRTQYAIHSSSSYVTAQVQCKCLQTLASPTDHQGAQGIHAIILAPFDGDVRSLNDLKGRRLAVPKPPATITRALPLKKLNEAGFDNDGDLGTLVDVENPVEGWQKVLAKEADAVIGWSTLQGDVNQGYSGGTLDHLINQTGLAKSTDLRIIWQSDLVPHGPHTIRADAPTELKRLLEQFLTTMKTKNELAFDAVSPLLSGGFAKISEKDFEVVASLVRPDDSERNEEDVTGPRR